MDKCTWEDLNTNEYGTVTSTFCSKPAKLWLIKGHKVHPRCLRHLSEQRQEIAREAGWAVVSVTPGFIKATETPFETTR